MRYLLRRKLDRIDALPVRPTLLRANHMVRTVTAFASVTLLIAITNFSMANSSSWSCSYSASAGLRWVHGGWQTSDFAKGQSFSLAVQNGALTTESAAVPLSSSSSFISCPQDQAGRLYCFDPSGAWLVFDPKTGRGGVSKIYTAIKNPPNPGSTLSVEPFTCSDG